MSAIREMPILIVDDAKFSTAVIHKCLETGGYSKLLQASSAEEAMLVLNKTPTPIVIVDWLMPGVDGLALTKQIRALDEQKHRYTYIIMLTAKDGGENLHNAFNVGIDDFINKSSMKEQLLPRILAASRVIKQHLQERKKLAAVLKVKNLLESQNAQLKRLCDADPLTKLGNLNYLIKKLDDHLNHCRTRGSASCFILISINLKETNIHELPAPIQQEIIKEVAKRLKASVRPLDEITRPSAAEFGIIAYQPNILQCQPETFKRLFTALNNHAFQTAMGYYQVELSMVVMTLSQHNQDNSVKTIEKARALTKQTTADQRIIYHVDDTPINPQNALTRQ